MIYFIFNLEKEVRKIIYKSLHTKKLQLNKNYKLKNEL